MLNCKSPSLASTIITTDVIIHTWPACIVTVHTSKAKRWSHARYAYTKLCSDDSENQNQRPSTLTADSYAHPVRVVSGGVHGYLICSRRSIASRHLSWQSTACRPVSTIDSRPFNVLQTSLTSALLVWTAPKTAFCCSGQPRRRCVLLGPWTAFVLCCGSVDLEWTAGLAA